MATTLKLGETVTLIGTLVQAQGGNALRFDGYGFDVGISQADVSELSISSDNRFGTMVEGTVLAITPTMVGVLFKGAPTYVDCPISAVAYRAGPPLWERLLKDEVV